MTIHPMTTADIPFCATLEKDCFSEPWSPNAFHEALHNPNTLCLVARLEEVNAGYLVAENICGEINLYTIAVAPGLRGCGVGTALLAALTEKASALRAFFITLEVRASNAAAVALYEKHGFRCVGLRKAFYRQPAEDAILMTLSISEETEHENTGN